LTPHKLLRKIKNHEEKSELFKTSSPRFSELIFIRNKKEDTKGKHQYVKKFIGTKEV